jgi:hypothetical protein
VERHRRTVQQGARIGRLRAARYRAERDRRAQVLGYVDAADLLRRRYLVGDATVAELAAALGCAEITVTAEMDRLGIRRRPQHARLSQGRQALAASGTLAYTAAPNCPESYRGECIRRGFGTDRSVDEIDLRMEA